MLKTTSLAESIAEVRFNPSAIQRAAIHTLETAMGGGFEVPDPTSPYVNLLEASAVMASVAMQEDEALTRKQYASVAVSEEDIYLHMSSADYIGRFSTPARTSYSILIGKDEVRERAVATGANNTKMMLIPSDTRFTAPGYVFTMHYGIEIRVLGHGGIQIVYDTDKVSPLEALESNIVDWSELTLNNIDFIRINIPVSQFSITSHYSGITDSTPFNNDYIYTDNYYYCRVYLSETDGSWKEIATTHTDQIFDPMNPTALLTVMTGVLNVRIPEIYYSNKSLGREIRVDIHTTKGALELQLNNYGLAAFGAEWLDISGDPEKAKYIQPILDFKTIAPLCDQRVTGGTNGLAFDEFRSRVIDNSAGTGEAPITDLQLSEHLADSGYSLVKRVDDITSRIYMASKELPAPAGGEVSSGIGANMALVSINPDELVKHGDVIDNGERITVTPDVLYTFNSGLTTIVPKHIADDLHNLPIESLATVINSNNYVYSPFHYVLTGTGKYFSIKPYYLDRPKAVSKIFREENGTSGLAVGIGAYRIVRTETGYTIQVVTNSGDAFKEIESDRVAMQLSFIPDGEVDRAYLNGTLIGVTDEEESIYEFELETTLDIDVADNLIFNNFKMYDADTLRKTGTPLTNGFDLFIAVTEHRPTGSTYSDIDLKLGHFLLGENPMGIVHETINLKFGDALNELWSNARAVPGSEIYATHEHDELAYYEKNIYKYGEDGLIELEEVDGNIKFVIEHAEGDPVMEDGEHVYKHRKGDLVYVDGEVVVVNGRSMEYHLDMMMLDGIYRFATDNQAVSYRDEIPSLITDWMREDIYRISRRMLEQTDLFFRPKSTLGNIGVIVGEGKRMTIPAEQSFEVEFYMSLNEYQNLDLRKVLTTTAINVISNELTKTTVTMDNMIATLKNSVDSSVISVNVTGLGGDEKLNALTILDESTRCSINKKIRVLANETTTVEDDVAVSFLLHQE